MKHSFTSYPAPPRIRFSIWATLYLLLALAYSGSAQVSNASCNSFTALTSPTFGSLSVTSSQTLGSDDFSPKNNLIDASLANSANNTFLGAGSVFIEVKDNSAIGANVYPGGSFAGFAVNSASVLSTFGTVTITTYLGNTQQDVSSTSSLVATNLLGGASRVGIYTTAGKDFDRVRVTFTAIGASTVNVYYALVEKFCDGPALSCNTTTTLNSPAFPVIVNPANTGFSGLLTVGSITNQDNAISADPTDAASLAVNGSVAGSGSFSIKLQGNVLDATNTVVDGYPAGTFAGFDISNPQLVGADVNSGIRVQTYYKGVATADVAASGSLFVAGNTSLLTGTGRRVIGLVTTTIFDEVKLTVSRGLFSVDVGTTLIYGAVAKRLCAATIACNTTYPLTNTAFPTVIDPVRTGLTGIAGVALTIQNQDNVITADQTDYATITSTAAVATTASIGVLDPVDTYPAGTFAGFTLFKPASVLAASLFSRLTITTYLDGVAQESKSAGNLLDLSISLFGAPTGFFNAGFVTTLPFDEIQLNVIPFADLGLTSNQLRVYGAFIDTRSSLGNGLVCALTTNPDFAITNRNIPITSSVSVNDVVPAGTTYGPTPTLLSSPGSSVPSITVNSDGSYTFVSATPGVYVYYIPVCLSSVCTSQTLTVTVLDPTVNTNNPVANPDVASVTGASTTPSSVTINVRGNDKPGNTGGSLNTPTIAIAPANGTASIDGNGIVTYTPNPGFYGTDVLTYQVCETPSTPACTTATVTITVKAPGSNNTTLAADDYISTYQGISISGNVKTNDSDPEGNTQTITAQTTTIPGKGTLVLNTDGTYSFTPVAGATGPVAFTYTSTDNGSPVASARGTLNILINPFNPNPDFAVTNKGVAVTGSARTNDVVPVGATYGTAVLASSPSGSAPVLTLTSTGSYTFSSATPGVYIYNVPVCTIDQPPVCATQTLTITVLDPTVTNNNPTADPDFITTTGSAGSPSAVTVNVKVNDGPGNTGGSLNNPTIAALPAHGTASIDGSGNLVYTPTAGYYGTDVVTYQVCETPSTPACATATVTITVVAPGSPAVVSANDDYVSTKGSTPATGNVITNDVGTSLTVSNPGTTVTSSGTLVVTSTGSYTFTPASGVTGPTDFTYTACDNNSPSACSSATLHVLVGVGLPDLTPSQLFSSSQLQPGETVDMLVSIRNVAASPTTANVNFSVTNYIASTGLTVVLNTDPTVTIGGITYTLNTSDFSVSTNPFSFAFTSVADPAGIIMANGRKFIAFRITRSADATRGFVTSTITIANGTGGGETPTNNNSIANTILKP